MKSDIEKIGEYIGPENAGRFIFRALLVFSCCWLGATFTFTPMVGMRFGQFPDALVPELGYAPWLLLGAVVVQSVILSGRGKVSASWAVMAFGSLCTCMITLLVTKVWYDFDVIRERWSGILFLTLLAGLFIYFGLKASFRADWTRMFCWSIPTFCLAFVCGVGVNYGQYFYCGRHNLLHSAQSADTAATSKSMR